MAETVILDSMSRWNDVAQVIQGATIAYAQGSRLVVDVTQVLEVWPNACVPIAAVLQHYKSLGMDVRMEGEGYRIQNRAIRNPLQATPERMAEDRPMQRVWAYFDEHEATALTDQLIRVLQRTTELSPGVLEALNVCLYEILDNVFQHSGADAGYFMAQLTRQSRRLLVSVADTGIGVKNSFVGSSYSPPTHFDALTLAIQSGVTRTGDRRGNGLYFLQRSVEENGGSLSLHSGPGLLRISSDTVSGRDYITTPTIDRDHQSLFIDWQVDLSRPIDLQAVMGTDWADLGLESLEDDLGEHVVAICEHPAGTGTRKAAEQLRLYLVNLLNRGAPRLTLDFTGVIAVSASFADEVIGKLAAEYGPVQFFSKFRLRNMNPTIEALLDRAIRIRIGADTPPPVAR